MAHINCLAADDDAGFRSHTRAPLSHKSAHTHISHAKQNILGQNAAVADVDTDTTRCLIYNGP